MFTLIKFLFIGKVDDFCLPVGYTCDNWEMFLEGRCATCEKVQRISQCQLMGLYPTYWKSVIVENKPGVGQKYFLNTAKDGDFCCNSNQFLLMFFIVLFSEFDVWSDVTVYHYQMAFHLSPDSEAKSNGEFELTLNAVADKNLKNLTIKRIVSKITPGRIHTILVTFKFMVKDIKKLSLKWHKLLKRLNLAGIIINIKVIEINYLSHISEKWVELVNFK